MPYAFYPVISDSDSDEDKDMGLLRGDIFRRNKKRKEQQQLVSALSASLSTVSVRPRVRVEVSCECEGKCDLPSTSGAVNQHSTSGSQPSSSTSGSGPRPAPVDGPADPHQGAAARLPTDQPWCRCGNCAELPTALERKCCFDECFNLVNFQDDQFNPGQQCLLTSNILLNTVLHRNVVGLLWMKQMRYKGLRREEMYFERMKPSECRYHAYSSYINFIHGFLGPKNRRVIPACIVTHIRTSWPDPESNYTGFRAADDDEQQRVFNDELQKALEEYDEE